jgi:hypothetical protein
MARMVFAPQGLQDSARRFNAGNIRSVVSWRLSVVSCQENLRFASGTKITAVLGWSLPRRSYRTQPDVSTPGTSDQLSVVGCR